MLELILDLIVDPIADYFFIYRDSVDPSRSVINWVTSILLTLGALFCLAVTVFCIAAKWWLIAIPAGAGCVWCTVKELRHVSECIQERR